MKEQNENFVKAKDDLKKFNGRGEGKVLVVNEAPAALISKALAHGQDLNQLEKLLELQIKYEENEARKAYHEDLARFNEVAPPVSKDKFNKAFDSWYTSLGNLLNTYGPVLGQFGLSISFPTPKQTEKAMEVFCKLSHRMGHSETTSMSGPIDASPVGGQSGKRVRNPLQDVKSTFTYLRSATCEAVLGVAGTEGTINDNGNAGSISVEFITKEQVKELTKELKGFPDEGKAFLEWLEVETVDTITAGKQYNQALSGLKDAKKGQ